MVIVNASNRALTINLKEEEESRKKMGSKERMLAKLDIRINEFTNNRPGPKWVQLFLQRHPEISLRTPQAIGKNRSDVTEEEIREWFLRTKNYLLEKNLMSLLEETERIRIMLFAFSFCIGCGLCAQQKVQTTRTALHIARSLDPDSMESVLVKTKSGDHTTIIVKKRHGRSDVNTPNIVPSNGTASHNYTLINKSEHMKNSTGVESFLKELREDDKINSVLNSGLNRTDQNTNAHVPDPVFISSSMVFVKHDDINPTKKGKSLVKVDADGIPVITGVRVPDDDSDQQIWRNARVINGILVPYNKGDKEPLSKQKPSYKPTTVRPFGGSKDNWLKISSINEKPTKISAESASMKTDVWNENKWHMYRKPSSSVPLKLQIDEQTSILQTVDPGDDVEKTRPMFNKYTQHPTGIWMASDLDENPDHKYVTDRILEYIRNINKEEMKRLALQKFTARDARMLPSSDKQPQAQSRILQVPGVSIFPSTTMYSSSTQSPSRVSFEEGVRTPVLQYAHPEYGVQSAKSEPSLPEIADKKDDTSLHTEDIHADRGPFVFEPAAPATGKSDTLENLSSKRSHTIMSPYHQRPKKTLMYFGGLPEKHSYSPFNYDPKPYIKHSLKDGYKINEYPNTVYYGDLDGRPFWIRLGDSLKEQVQSGIDKMTDLTRPVVEPLVEATQKISHNLGLTSRNRDLNTVREKLGSVSGSSLILPAIGIVAGGAALGLGAVAVGRYLNYDVVKMRSGKSMDGDDSLLTDHITTSNLESLWAEDNSRSSDFAVGMVISRTNNSASDSHIANTTSHSITTLSSDKMMDSENPKKVRRKRSTRNHNVDNYLGSLLQDLETVTKSAPTPSSGTYTRPIDMWSSIFCSKKIFCQAMLTHSKDSVAILEKKIYTYLSSFHPSIATSAAPHLNDVMNSVKLGNCSIYSCLSSKSVNRSKDT